MANRETTSCIHNGHGWIPTANGPVFATRARTCWWQVGRSELAGDACEGYSLASVSPGCMLVDQPTRLYRDRCKAAKAAKRFHQEPAPCDRPDIETMAARGHVGRLFRELVAALYPSGA